MERLLLAALALTSPIFVNPGMAAAPAEVAAAGGRWEAVPLPDEVEDAPLALAWSRSDPSIVYGRGRRALWRSEDGGRSWTATGFMGDEESPWWEAPARRHMGRPPNWGRSLAVDAGDPRTVYVRSTAFSTEPVGGYGDVWSRVRSAAYVSRDGGASWQDLSCLHVAADPVRPGRLYGVSADLQLQLSNDAGRTWRDLGLSHPRLVNGLYAYASAADPRRILIGSPGQFFVDLWRSDDGGTTWTQAVLGRGFDHLAVDHHVAGRLYGLAGDSVFVSDNDGDTWRLLHAFRRGPVGFVSHPQAGRLAAVTDTHFWTSDDGGETWQIHDAASGITDVAFDPADPRRLLLTAAAELRGHLFESRDGGHSWSPMAPPQLPPPVGTLAVSPEGHLWAGSATEPDENSRLPVLYLRDGGAWQRLGPASGWSWQWGPVRSLFFHPQNPEVMLADFGYVLRSEDGGHTWQWTKARRDAYAQGPSPFHTRADRPAVIYFRGEVLWRSVDTGITWQSLPSSLRAIFLAVGFEPSVSEPGAIVHATDRALIRTVAEDGSPRMVSTVPDGGYLVALCRHPLSPQQLIVAAVVGDGVAVYAVDDDGRDWRQLGRFEGIFPVTYLSLSSISADDFLCGWRRGGHGIARLRFHPTDPDVYYLVFRRDLLVTRDGGHTWQRVEDGPTSVPWYTDVAVDPDAPDDLYVGTPLGLFRLRGAINTAVGENRDATPDAFALGAAYPNPFNAGTVIPVTLAHATHTRVEVHDLLGQRVRVLADGPLGAGTHRLRWNGRDDAGRALGTSVYLVRLRAGTETRAMRVLLLK